MYDPSLQEVVLRLLEKWGRLPLTDLVGMIDPLQRPRFRPELIDDMEWEGLITMQSMGDDSVVELTPKGKDRLVIGRPSLTPPPPEA